jgi:ribonuclease Z
MNPSFSSYLVNDVFGDPGVYVEVRWSKRALLFDLGQIDGLGPTRLLRAGEIFVSHTHMDHFIGFDAVLRVALGRGKTLRLFGPPGLIDNLQGKLRGYTWNLVDGYPLTIVVREFHKGERRQATFLASNGFQQPEHTHHLAPQLDDPLFTVMEDPMFTVKAVALNHRIPSFAYMLEEQFHINVNKQRLHEAGLRSAPGSKT